jgi:RNA polymerase sigma factor (sigma-70 family)
MATIITNYTTYDLAYYYADLRRLPRLSREERQHLLTGLSGIPISPAIPQDDTQIKQRLIESYLPFAKYLAITLCPPTLYQRLLPELIGAVNLAVVEAVMRCDLGSTLSLDAYVAAYVRGAIKQTIVKDDVLTIPFRARERARAEGTLDQLYAQQRVASLDEQMEWFDTDKVEEPPVKPILPTEAAPARNPVLRAQVDTLLSYLSPRAQAIFRLRYGLSDDNERRHTTNEIACLLGLDRRLVLTTERDVLARLKALAAGKATLGKKNGKPYILYPDAHNTYTITPEQEAALLRGCLDLQTQGIIVTGRSLAKASGTSVGHALMFLRLHRAETPKEARARQRQQKLAEVCTRLEAQGVRVTSPLLASEAGVMKKTAIDFLKARRSTSHAAA